MQGFWYFARSRTREIQVFPRRNVRETTSQNYKAFLDERCEKLGTNHNVNSFSIRWFLERTVVERANDYPC